MRRLDRSSTECVKYDREEIARLCGNAEAEPFWVADMDFECPGSTRKALAEAAGFGLYGYHCISGGIKAFLDWAKLRHDYEPDPDLVVQSMGILNSISLVISGMDATVIVPTPAYRPFFQIAQNFERKLVQWQLAYDSNLARFSLDLESLESIIKADTLKKVLVFCSPHNPSGRVWSEEELLSVARLCAQNDVTVLCDEIHADLAYRGFRHIPFGIVARKTGCRCVTFMAPSKTFNMAGEHYSITIFNDKELCEAFKFKQEQFFLTEPSLFSTTAAIASYKGGYDWLADLTRTLQDNAEFVDFFLKKHCPRIRMVMPQASFVCFLDCTDLRRSLGHETKMNSFFGKEASVAVNDGSWFGEGYGNFVRFNIGTDRKHIEGALRRIAEAVSHLG